MAAIPEPNPGSQTGRVLAYVREHPGTKSNDLRQIFPDIGNPSWALRDLTLRKMVVREKQGSDWAYRAATEADAAAVRQQRAKKKKAAKAAQKPARGKRAKRQAPELLEVPAVTNSGAHMEMGFDITKDGVTVHLTLPDIQALYAQMQNLFAK